MNAKPIRVGDRVTVTGTVVAVNNSRGRVLLDAVEERPAVNRPDPAKLAPNRAQVTVHYEPPPPRIVPVPVDPRTGRPLS